MDLAGAAAIVTGGASGIGRACANRLAGLGAQCVILDIQAAKGAEAARGGRRDVRGGRRG